jgi:hypothetical protein
MQHQIVRYGTFVSKSEKTVVLLIAREQKNHPVLDSAQPERIANPNSHA